MPSMKRFTAGILNRTKSSDRNVNEAMDAPESNAIRAVKTFCETATPGNQGEEVLQLPIIVEAAECSPQAAGSAAYQIRKILSKDNYNKPHVQYNAIMLIRILAQNPGPSFTQHIDKKFVDTVHALLRDNKDPSVQQMMRETLDSLEAEKGHDPGLKKLLAMWRTIKGWDNRVSPQHYRRQQQQQQGGPSPRPEQEQRGYGRRQLPPPHELFSRVEESKNSGKILLQLIQSTPPEEVLNSDLIKEFAERCQSAQRSMQEYINCDSPPPDDDTLQTLIEVNEQLSLALSRYQRAVLSARRAAGTSSTGTSPNPEAQMQHQLSGQSQDQAPPQPPRPPKDAFSRQSQATIFPSKSQTTVPQSLQPGRRPVSQSPLPPLPEAPRPAHPEPAYNSANAPTLDPFTDTAERSDYGHGGSSSISSASQQRPGQTYFANGATQSYMGRQLSAANGLTMHGAGIEEEEHEEDDHMAGRGLAEMDGDSRVGRLGVDTAGANTNHGRVVQADDDDDDLYSNSPVRVKGSWKDV